MKRRFSGEELGNRNLARDGSKVKDRELHMCDEWSLEGTGDQWWGWRGVGG